MFLPSRFLWTGIAIAAISTVAHADDCTAIKSAMLESGHKPRTVTVTSADAQGKQVVTQQIQTETNKYIQTRDGQWHVMNIAIKDLNDNTDTVKQCSRLGSERVNGESTTTYTLSYDTSGAMMEQKIWVSSKNLILKSEGKVNGGKVETTMDYSTPKPPANAIPMGGKH